MKELRLTDFPVRAGHFATEMRAYSFAEMLENNGVPAMVHVQEWTNKRLPPPRVEVMIQAADAKEAADLFAIFITGGEKR